MKKKHLYLVFLTLLLTSCAQNNDGIQEIHIEAEDIIYNNEDAINDTEGPLPIFSEETVSIPDDFDGTGYFQEYASLAAPASISGIEFQGKELDRYIFSFPDDEDTAKKLYNEYGALIQSDGFTLEEYEGNYIIKNSGEPVAFMGTGYNAEHDYIMLIAFYPEE